MTSKELQKMLDATRRDVGREHGFRQSSYINFKIEKGYFFSLHFSLEDARLEVKPMLRRWITVIILYLYSFYIMFYAVKD